MQGRSSLFIRPDSLANGVFVDVLVTLLDLCKKFFCSGFTLTRSQEQNTSSASGQLKPEFFCIEKLACETEFKINGQSMLCIVF